MTTPKSIPKSDSQEIRRGIALLLEPGGVYEFRAFGRGTTSGYFTDFNKLAQAVAGVSGKVPACYFTINPVDPDLLARAANRLQDFARTTTNDLQIVKRRWLPIDFDPVRPAGISSTDAEHEAAIDRARECREWLAGRGWPDPVFIDSGNGAHLLYPVELPNDEAATQDMSKALQALAFKFDDVAVAVDTGNFNPARIWKIPGTLAMKGDNTPERPHRLSRILEAPAWSK
ncbi:MAG: hypothetical protein ACE5Q6_03860 [Dehalococcoidia bacterium]